MTQPEPKNIIEELIDETLDSEPVCRVHLLDVGADKYGDCILCEIGEMRILIDGSHPSDFRPRSGHRSIPQQLEAFLGAPPFELDLLVVTHAHADHIGCLPALVTGGTLKTKWALLADPALGWGRDPDSHRVGNPTDEAEVLAAALREENHDNERDEVLERFLLDAANLEDSYHAMIARLQEDRAQVVLFGRDDHRVVEEAFGAIGMRVLGPTPEHLRLCSQRIERAGRDDLGAISDFLGSRDELKGDWIAAYRALSGTDGGSIGAAINNQTIVLRFDYQGRKLLFTGDMQFASPDVSGLETEMTELRRRIKEDGPWTFVKVAHHGSYNAFNESVLEEMGATRYYGISTGEQSMAHPHPSTLAMLDAQRQNLKWARTDRNRAVTFDFSAQRAQIALERGEINDPHPNARDEFLPLVAPNRENRSSEIQGSASRTEVEPQSSSPPSTGGRDDIVEVITRVPRVATRVTVSIEVQPLDNPPPVAKISRVPDGGTLPSLDPKAPRVGGGRVLPPLLFVTNREALAHNIGVNEAALALQGVREGGHMLIDDAPSSVEASEVAPFVGRKLKENPSLRGVVILGGYDVVPAQRLDALPPHLRRILSRRSDPDNFVVWSDALYGDTDGDGFPELPVSRVPDGKSAALVWAALQARSPQQDEATSTECQGVRNKRRPFAEEVFSAMGGRNPMLSSGPATCEHPPLSLNASKIYLMLHGDHADGSRFWGEDVSGGIEAINLSNLPLQCEGTVFTGCCWGALTSEEPAAWAPHNAPVRVKTPETSLALGFLARGVQAFVGCTGAHYSPVVPPLDHYGGPLHRAFWIHYDAGFGPAESLLAAKIEFLKGMPHGQTAPSGRAIEHKILHQYTCLGLGW